ncbi:type II toxin-antitoxin system RelE/ParE family toxin [Taklimakanibacter lacteus]|uniref:type II toxin-antitoxin system RelE/ParE family toxin n=1 Tax=Taklimakanibacter lacteus TaxID=2268456 RepID=UPI000E672DE6
MKVRHTKKETELVETDQAHKSGLPVAVIAAARRKLRFIRDAKDERDLRAMKSNHFEKMKGSEGQYSIRLNDQYRLILEFDLSCNPREVVIVAITDYH